MGVISLCSLNDQFTKFYCEFLFKFLFLYVFPKWNYPYKMITFFSLKYTYANSLLVSLIHLDKIQVAVVSDYGEYEWDGMDLNAYWNTGS